MEQFIADNPQIPEFLGGGANIFDSFLALSMVMAALLAAAFGVIAVLRARGEETSGRAEPVLATATSRNSWLSSHVTRGTRRQCADHGDGRLLPRPGVRAEHLRSQPDRAPDGGIARLCARGVVGHRADGSRP